MSPERTVAFGPPPGATRPGAAPGSYDASAPPAAAAAGASPSPSVPGTPTNAASGGYPPPGYPPPSYPPPAYPPSGYPPPGYPPASYPPAPYPGAASPPGYYPYPQPGYPPNYYPPPPRPRAPGFGLAPGAQTHDGLYLRMQLGLATVDLKGTIPGTTVTYAGAGASAGLAVGYTVAPHLTLYLDFLIAGAGNTTPHVNGYAQTGVQGSPNVFGIGPGLSFDFGPNVFVAATVLLAGVYVDDTNGSSLASSKSGAAIELQLGKEWWVSDNWGLGLSGQFIYGSMKGSDRDPSLDAVPDWRVVAAAILFSATYN